MTAVFLLYLGAREVDTIDPAETGYDRHVEGEMGTFAAQ